MPGATRGGAALLAGGQTGPPRILAGNSGAGEAEAGECGGECLKTDEPFLISQIVAISGGSCGSVSAKRCL